MVDLTWGYCRCGCGERTTIATKTDARWGTIKGQPRQWIRGHCNRKPQFVVQDCGYLTPCWVWRQTLNERGYPQMHDGGRTRRAHRVFYERTFGLIPDGLTLDHLCRNKMCVNPHHLEPTTRLENHRRWRVANGLGS